MQDVTMFITHISDKGAAFGVRTDTSEGVFLHSKFVQDLDAQIGDRFNVTVIPNTPDVRDRTPWMTVGVSAAQPVYAPSQLAPVPVAAPVAVPVAAPVAAPVDKALSNDALDALLLNHLNNYSFASTRELVDLVNEPVTRVANAMARLFTAGKCVQAKVYRKATQTEASFAVWALSVEEFLGVDGEA